jgi:hypothetical protein
MTDKPRKSRAGVAAAEDTAARLTERLDAIEERLTAIEGVIRTQAIQATAPGPYSDGTVDERLTALEAATGVNSPPTTHPADGYPRNMLARLDRLEQRPGAALPPAPPGE